MKNFIKSLILCAALLGANANAQQVAFSTSLAFPWTLDGTNLLERGGLLTSLIAVNTSDKPVLVTLFDAPRTNNQGRIGRNYWTNAAYTSVSQYLTNLTIIVTNFSGVMSTNTFTNALYSYTNTVGSVSNTYPVLYNILVPANGSIVPNIGNGLYFGSGINITNNGFLSATTNVIVSGTALKAR